ncbi:MAG: oligosaccharide flippase family protein [Clostridiales bacterium]|nr:oligosaccharide flippase family protein [Clostridiales bacterium]
MKLRNKETNSFERNSILLFALMMGANVCNYLFQIIVGNLMEIESYAQVNTVIAIVSVLSIPTTIITMICARYIALNVSMEHEARLAAVIRVLFRFTITVALILVAGVLLLLNRITSIFTLHSKWYVVGALAIAILNLFFSITAGTLQGMKRFFPYGVQSIIVALGKLIFSVILIWVGWSVYGVIAAVWLGILLAIVYGLCHVGHYVKEAIYSRGASGIEAREFIKYAVGTIVAQGCVVALTSGDILLVKAYFSDTEAGLYSSAMVIGKIAMYVSTAIVATLFPMVVEKHQKGEDAMPLLKKAMLYGGGVSAICAIGMVTLGRFVIGILFGERYLSAIAFLPAVCMYVVPLTFVTILMNYILAVGKVKVFDVTMAFSVAAIIGLSLCFHSSVQQLMTMCGCILWLVFFVNLICLYLGRKRNDKV